MPLRTTSFKSHLHWIRQIQGHAAGLDPEEDDMVKGRVGRVARSSSTSSAGSRLSAESCSPVWAARSRLQCRPGPADRAQHRAVCTFCHTLSHMNIQRAAQSAPRGGAREPTLAPDWSPQVPPPNYWQVGDLGFCIVLILLSYTSFQLHFFTWLNYSIL